MESDSSNDVRRRIARASYVQDQYTLTHCSVSSDRGPLHSSSPSDSTAPRHDTGSLPHGLERMAPLEPRALSRWESPWTHASSSDGTDAGNGRVGGSIHKVVDLRTKSGWEYFWAINCCILLSGNQKCDQ